MNGRFRRRGVHRLVILAGMALASKWIPSFKRTRAWLNLEWVFPDDLYSRAFSEITPQLYLGGRPSVDDVVDLKDNNITHVVSCLRGKHRVQVDFLKADFEHLFLEADDSMHEEMADTFETFLRYTDEVLAAEPKAKVFVHCEVGVSRSASLVVAHVMQNERLSFLDAFEKVRSKRFQVLPNIGFASQLQRLEHKRLLTPPAIPSSLAIYLLECCNAPVELDVLQDALEQNDYDAPAALRAIFGGEIPRVMQGIRTG